MPKGQSSLIEIQCPCCEATLKIDPATRAVISHKVKEKAVTAEDWTAAVHRVKGEASKREEAFQKSLAEHKVHQDVLNKKFDELFKQAKADPNAPPPRRDIDLD